MKNNITNLNYKCLSGLPVKSIFGQKGTKSIHRAQLLKAFEICASFVLYVP